MKPHIHRQYVDYSGWFWRCDSADDGARGATPAEAYAGWRRNQRFRLTHCAATQGLSVQKRGLVSRLMRWCSNG